MDLLDVGETIACEGDRFYHLGSLFSRLEDFRFAEDEYGSEDFVSALCVEASSHDSGVGGERSQVKELVIRVVACPYDFYECRLESWVSCRLCVPVELICLCLTERVGVGGIAIWFLTKSVASWTRRWLTEQFFVLVGVMTWTTCYPRTETAALRLVVPGLESWL